MHQGEGAADVGGEGGVEAKGQGRVVAVPADGAAVHRDAVQMRLPQAQRGVEGILHQVHAKGLVEEGGFELLQPEGVVGGEDVVEVFVDHLQQDEGARVVLQVGQDNLPRKVLAQVGADLASFFPLPGLAGFLRA